MAERIQKVLAAAGHGSRRKVEAWIREGRLRIDGRQAALGDRVEGGEKVTLDQRPLSLRGIGQPHRFFRISNRFALVVCQFFIFIFFVVAFTGAPLGSVATEIVVFGQ